MKKIRLPFSAFMIHAFNPIMNSNALSAIQKQVELSKYELVSGGKRGKAPRQHGHKHMAYVRKMRKIRNRNKRCA